MAGRAQSHGRLIAAFVNSAQWAATMWRRGSRMRLIAAFVAPALALYVTFVIYPYGRAIYVAVTNWRGLKEPPRFNGLDNFRRMLSDDNFWNALTNTAVYLALIPLCTIAFSLFLASRLAQRVKFSDFYRVVFFLPQVVPIVAIGLIWSYVYHPTFGTLNSVLAALRLEPVFKVLGFDSLPIWMGDPRTAAYAIAAVVVWSMAGFFMVIFLAAMQSIPETYYEAARLDGASSWTMFRHITVPLLRTIIRLAFIFSTIGAVDMFAIVMVMTNGQRGPDRSTDVLATYLYEQAFTTSRFGYATAIALVLFVMMLVLSFAITAAYRGESYEYA